MIHLIRVIAGVIGLALIIGVANLISRETILWSVAVASVAAFTYYLGWMVTFLLGWDDYE